MDRAAQLSLHMDESILRIWAEEHAHRLRKANAAHEIEAAWQCYAIGDDCRYAHSADKSLLATEMAYAEQRNRLPSPHANRTLVILVGESFHPLLQTIEAHGPKRLVAVVNRMYGDEPYRRGRPCEKCRKGKKHWELLHRCIKHMPASTGFDFDLDGDLILLEDEEESRPVEVFEKLRDKLHGDLALPADEKEIVIDITGAKKTMVSGAFMLAAYTRAKISYVDTHLFDEGAPLGFSFHIRYLYNPLVQLSLDVWDAIAQAYGRYDFGEARRLLKTIQAELQDVRLTQLSDYLAICDYWQNGELRKANDRRKALDVSLPVALPIAVELLGDFWPTATDTSLNSYLFTDDEAMLVYGKDELERAKRQKEGGNHRAAFARAFALHETLLRGRLLTKWSRNELTVEIRQVRGGSWSVPTDHNDVQDAVARTLILAFSTPTIFKILYETVDSLEYKSPNYPLPPRASAQFHSLRVQQLQQDDQADLQVEHRAVKDERNWITHSYYPVSAELAQKAIDLTQANFGDFKAHWANGDEQKPLFRCLAKWETVKEKFNLDMIPTKIGSAESSS